MSNTTRHYAYRRHSMWENGLLGKGAPHGKPRKAERRNDKQDLQRKMREE